MIFWISTVLISLFLLISSYTYFFSPTTIVGIKELGFPVFFRVELGVLKVIASLILLLPKAPLYMKEWSYAGAGLFLLTALVAHIAHKDSMGVTVLLVFLLLVLSVSRYTLKATI